MALSGVVYDMVTPSNLSEVDVRRIGDVEADMWGRKEGLGTYMYCGNCDITFSKQDIYAEKIDTRLYQKTVFEIEQATSGKYLCCPNCEGKLEAIFHREEYVSEIRERYSSGAMLLIMRHESEIVGFMDGHISDYDTIFRRDLSYRYTDERKDEIADAICRKIGAILPDRMFSCSSMGTTEGYMNFNYIYQLLHNFFGNFPVDYEDDLGISELNSGGSLDKIYKSLGSESIGIISGDQKFQTDSYDSGLFIQRRLGRVYKDAFSGDLKTFLRNKKMREKSGA